MRTVCLSLLAPTLALVACADVHPADVADAGPQAPDSSPPADADPGDECVEGSFQLLDNPHFDDGPVDWDEVAGPLIFPDEQIPITPHTGTRAAWLGRAGTADQTLSQAFALPLGTRSLRFRGQTCLVTTEEDAAAELDTLEIYLVDAEGAPVATLRHFSNEDAAEICNWVPFDVVHTQEYAPGPVELVLHAISVAGGQTSFYVDSLSLDANTRCP